LRSLLTSGLLALACLCNSASAEVLNFTIDSSQSFLSIAIVGFDGTTYTTPQTPGSDTTSSFGNLLVDVTGSGLQFLTTGQTHFNQQALPQAPLPDGSPGTATAMIGLALDIPGTVQGVLAGRNYVSDATSPVIPLVGNTFDASQMDFGFVQADVAFNWVFQGTPGSGTSGGPGTAPNLNPNGTLTLAGDLYTLSIDYRAAVFFPFGDVLTNVIYTGRTVATAQVPEPASSILAGLAAAALVVYGRKRRRRSAVAP